MNKKFITLCVSALLAGGMVTPAFATEFAGGTQYTLDVTTVNSNTYYLLKMNRTQIAGYSDMALKATNAGVYSVSNEVSEYTLWRIVPIKVNSGNDGEKSFELINKAGIKLGVNEDNELVPNGKYTAFNWYNGKTLGVTNRGVVLVQNSDTERTPILVGTSDTRLASFSACFFTPEVAEMTISDLNEMFLNGFTLGVGYYDANDNNKFKDYTTEHDLQGNPFQGQLTATNNIGTVSGSAGVTFATPDVTNNETYLKNGDEVVVLLNTTWSNLNNSLDATGYRFTTMTPVELANQLAADKADPSKAVVRSYIFKITAPDVVSDRPLEVAVRIDGTSTTWEELFVSEVNDNYYLTTAVADATDNSTQLQKADYANNTNKVYAYFASNNYVNADRFFSYAWNIVRTNDNKTMNPANTSNWVDQEEIGMTVPEGQWILRENAIKDGYEWVNRETKEVASIQFSGLRVTDEANVYRIGADQYYKITKAKNAAGVEINLDAWDEFDYYGADVKSNSTGVDNTYKIQFVSELTGEPIYIGINGVGTLELTNDPTKAVNFEADTVKTTDKTVIVNPEDANAYNDVFSIYNTYIGRDDKDENWIDKTDTVSFYRYNFMHDGKYLHFDAHNNKYVLVAPEYDNNGDIDNADEFDTFVIKEKGDDYVNILNVDNHDYDAFLKNDGNSYTNILAKDATGKDYVAGNKLLTYDGSNDNYTPISMMYFDFNFKEARQQVNIYDWEANAQLKLDYNDYNIYRNVAPTAPDTMAIYRTEYQDEFLFEKNGFLGMTVDDRGYNAALFIDTAYVRGNTEKPLFMIGLRPDITPETVYCPIHGVDAGCAHEHLDTIPGYVDADYMTVLADSAAAHAPELDNKFLANSKYTKLSFVAARHNVDTITVAADGHKTTISQNVQHPMVFAFRIVNQETQDFIIEGVDLTNNKAALSAPNPYKTSWVRWNNGVPVMTDRMEDAEVFNINGDIESAPTANESIEAEATVSVVATDGAVIVKGAEGKNVIVSTILGKVVANEVVNSDNETIAAPAGIVVVSVDGESFKVAVK